MHFLQVFGTLILTIFWVGNALSNETDAPKSTNETLIELEIAQANPYGYKRYQNSYYKYHTDPQVWEEARKVCVAEGGHLVIINSDEEADILHEIIFRNPKPPRFEDWRLVGFHDYFKQGRYVTIDGKDLELSGYTTWNEGEPNNNGGHENCGAISSRGGLNDFLCDLPTHYICEIPVKTCN